MSTQSGHEEDTKTGVRDTLTVNGVDTGLPRLIDPYARASSAAEAAREELRLDDEDETGAGRHAARAAAFASLAVYERLGVAELFAQFGPKVLDELEESQLRAHREGKRIAKVEAVAARVQVWLDRMEEKGSRLEEAYEAALRKRGL